MPLTQSSPHSLFLQHLEKLECCSKWDELQNEWLIEYVEHAGNHEAAKNALLQNQTNAQMLAVGGELS